MEMEEPLAVLIAEDDPNDALLLNRAFKKAGVVGRIHVCKDGEDAQDYLRGDGDYADRNKFPVPKILITDLKMPRCNGFELLQWVRDHPECSVIPTIILSASPQEEDIRRGYELGANCYFCKPTQFAQLVELVEMILKFWRSAMIPRVPNKCT